MLDIFKEKIKEDINASCFHCGDSCADQSIVVNGKYFCCHGCKMVYSILSENNLDTYYQLNPQAGTSQKKKINSTYSFLDDSSAIARLVNYSDDNMSKVVFYTPQIHCSSCLWLLENLHRINDGVMSSRVDFLRKEVQINFKHKQISLRELVELLNNIGYPPHIILKDLDQQQGKANTDKSLLYKLGVAGFAFGNIMLFSFPEYLGLSSHEDQFLQSVFSYLNLMLILPVLLYSGQDYFRSAWQGLKVKHLNIDVPVSLGIMALFFRSLYEIISLTGPGYLDSLAGLIFFLLIGRWFQQITYARMKFDRDFKSYFPIACNILKENQEVQITLDKIVVGDKVVVRYGELIPADGILLKGEAKIDYSFVSGESQIIEKAKGDHLYAGGRQMGPIIELAVTRTVSNSYLTQLWNEHTFENKKTGGVTSQLADTAAQFFTTVILVVSLFTLLYWLPTDIGKAINAFTSVLIVACPCAVALSIPFTFGNVIRIFAKQGIYFKNVNIIESLAKIDRIVFDKTGTITSVQSSKLIYEGENLSDKEKQLIFSLSRHSTHPVSKMIQQKYGQFKPLEVSEFYEEKAKGIAGFVEGALIRIGSASFIKESNPDEQLKSSVYIEIDNSIKGRYVQETSYRHGLSALLNDVKSFAKISLISGDNDMEKARLVPYFGADAELCFDQTPKAKLEYINRYQEAGQRVAMIGDGLNDAGALSQSDVGIVITENTANFTPACDVIMDARQFEKIPLLFNFSRLSIRIVMFSYAIALVYNVIGLTYAVQGLLSPVIAAILMPLSSVTIVVFGVFMSRFWASRKALL